MNTAQVLITRRQYDLQVTAAALMKEFPQHPLAEQQSPHSALPVQLWPQPVALSMVQHSRASAWVTSSSSDVHQSLFRQWRSLRLAWVRMALA